MMGLVFYQFIYRFVNDISVMMMKF